MPPRPRSTHAIEVSLDGDGKHDHILGGLADLARHFNTSPLFSTVDEFDDWMLMDSPLLLNPNMGS